MKLVTVIHLVLLVIYEINEGCLFCNVSYLQDKVMLFIYGISNWLLV